MALEDQGRPLELPRAEGVKTDRRSRLSRERFYRAGVSACGSGTAFQNGETYLLFPDRVFRRREKDDRRI